jgi:hypothetical protein
MENKGVNDEDYTGQFKRRSVAPLLLRTAFGKTEAEKWIYGITIFAWLILPWIVWESTANTVQTPLQAANMYLTATYVGIAILVLILTLSAALSKISIEPKAK